MKFPSFKGRRAKGAADGGFDDDPPPFEEQEDEPEAVREPLGAPVATADRKGGIGGVLLGPLGQGLVLLLLIGGLGALGFWLASNGAATASKRALLTPRATFSFLPPAQQQQQAAPPPAATPAPAEPQTASPPPAPAAPAPQAATPQAPSQAPSQPPQAAPAPAPAPTPAPRRQVALAHDPALVENTPYGLLPKIGAEGQQPWRAYAHAFPAAEQRPRIALIINGLGLSGAATEAAIQDLPAPVTLAFTPYAGRLGEWISMARAAGHEVLLSMPMEPTGFPQSDPGPHTLLTSLSPVENLDRMEWAMGRFTGYVGVVDFLGSRFTTDERALLPVLKAVKERGLMFVDSKSSSSSLAAQIAGSIDLPHAVNTRFIDNEASRGYIDKSLEELERVARRGGSAVGIGYAYPVTLERVKAWAATLPGKGLVLAPITATTTRQAPRG
ncbi:divergent polysaccharide deacetylase family protein [Oceanibaculum pacificum]|uniref:Divergent polysaccharide deacetylase n=1 Tax=Oceanibaculum pacificum TaxID=580166 RepID=A0A154W487_9PROT|nr:divergent polysaccharide deacetylase family protein [Oceanibaculum pacificum]KZD08375.1 hypothetical protein AUP43_01915 [Oceanibaculum pacificum]